MSDFIASYGEYSHVICQLAVQEGVFHFVALFDEAGPHKELMFWGKRKEDCPFFHAVVAVKYQLVEICVLLCSHICQPGAWVRTGRPDPSNTYLDGFWDRTCSLINLPHPSPP